MQTMPDHDHLTESDSCGSSFHSESGLKADGHRPLLQTVLGLDPGTVHLGWALLIGGKY